MEYDFTKKGCSGVEYGYVQLPLASRPTTQDWCYGYSGVDRYWIKENDVIYLVGRIEND